MYILQEYSRPGNRATLAAKSGVESMKLWHERLGHLGYATMFKLVCRGMVKGLDLTAKDMRPPEAESCILGKHHKKPC